MGNEHVFGTQQRVAVQPDVGQRGEPAEPERCGARIAGVGGETTAIPPVLAVEVALLVHVPAPARAKRGGGGTRDGRCYPAGCCGFQRGGRRCRAGGEGSRFPGGEDVSIHTAPPAVPSRRPTPVPARRSSPRS